MLKKLYSKPEIQFEDFSICNSIAANCAMLANSTVETCKVEVDYAGDKMEVFANGICDFAYPKDVVCYHVPGPTYNIFAS